MTEAEFSELSVKILVPGLILFMGYIVYDLARKHGAGKYGAIVLFGTLGLGTLGYIIKVILQATLEV